MQMKFCEDQTMQHLTPAKLELALGISALLSPNTWPTWRFPSKTPACYSQYFAQQTGKKD